VGKESGKFSSQLVDLGKVKTYPVAQRKSLVRREDLAPVARWQEVDSLSSLFPQILKGRDLREVREAIVGAVRSGKPVLWGLGAHVIKCGLSPLIIDLMKRGAVSCLAMNGAGAVHDFEMAFMGQTSEDVASELETGRFGMGEETGAFLNGAWKRYVKDDVGLGEAMGRALSEQSLPHGELSLVGNAYRLGIPVTLHVAVGTDIVHMHPSADGASIGLGSMNDFRLFTGVVTHMGEGGVYLNVGSAVVLPEVFLKALSVARNLAYPVRNFTTVNLDMISHYRPLTNVVHRPNIGGGRGYSLIGHHEIMIPILYQLVVEELEKTQKSGG